MITIMTIRIFSVITHDLRPEGMGESRIPENTEDRSGRYRAVFLLHGRWVIETIKSILFCPLRFPESLTKND